MLIMLQMQSVKKGREVKQKEKEGERVLLSYKRTEAEESSYFVEKQREMLND